MTPKKNVKTSVIGYTQTRSDSSRESVRYQLPFEYLQPPRHINPYSVILPQHRSDTNEWYTPHDPYIRLVRDVLGTIDLDPASNDMAQQWIQAKRYYTKDTNGLQHEWHGTVFLNPPYGKTGNKSNQGIWSRRLVRKYLAGHVREAILLVNSSTGTVWFQRLFAFQICFVDHRIKFIDEHGKQQKQPTHDNCFVYLGEHRSRFGEVFSQIGTIR